MQTNWFYIKREKKDEKGDSKDKGQKMDLDPNYLLLTQSNLK